MVALILVLIILTVLCANNSLAVEAQSANSWVEKAPMPTARFSFGVAVLNGKIYAVGGAVATQSGELSAANEEYDPITNMWAEKAPMPTQRYGCAVASYENKIYVFGGGINGSIYTNVTEVYDPVADTWVTKAAMPSARILLQANVVDDKIYLIGGYDNRTFNEVYDPATDSWTTKAPIPTEVVAYLSAVVDGKIYVIGGAFNNLTQIYDPKTDTWSSGASIPVGVSGAGGCTITGASGQKAIYVVGGETGIFSPQNLTQVYFPENDSWNLGVPLPAVRSRLCAAVVNDTLYALGGTRAVIHQGLTDNYQLALESEDSPAIIHDKHFTVDLTMWAFDGYHLLGSFNATEAYWVELNISSTSADPKYPDYIVELVLESANHGKTFVAGTSFMQTVKLNYTDAYNITVCKHAFSSSVTVTGAIDVYHKEAANSTPTPTYSPSPTSSPLPSPSPTSTPTASPFPSPSTSPTPTSSPSQQPTQSPETSANSISSMELIITTAGVIAVSVVALAAIKRYKRQV